MQDLALFGCSFFKPYVYLSQDWDFVNTTVYSHPGFGNWRILNSLIDHISKHKTDKVFVSWSGFDRDDAMMNPSAVALLDSEDVNIERDSNPIKFPWYCSGGYGGNYAFENDHNIFTPRYKYCDSFYIQVKKNISYILSAQSILKQHNIPYVFCFYSNQLENKYFATGMSVNSKVKHIDLTSYKNAIPSIDLIDFSKFWLYDNQISKFCGIEEFALAKNMLTNDNHHPTDDFMQLFWEESIMPLLFHND